jgi:hypothetical protein
LRSLFSVGPSNEFFQITARLWGAFQGDNHDVVERVFNPDDFEIYARFSRRQLQVNL